jgi:MYXO-CTERM domain-containing protein
MKLALSLAASGLCLALGVWSGNAHADAFDSCGNIDVEANAQCKVEVEGGCMVKCEPPQVRLACAAELQVDCAGECNVQATAECTGSCSADCEADCDVNPGSFDCKADCEVNAEANCKGECSGMASGSEARARCEGSCKATASAECNASCEGTPPSATCKAKCEASCKGSCKAEINAKCEVDCQAEGYVECEGRLEAKCKGQCDPVQGALFCDGQYVDHGGNLDKCIADLDAWLTANVDASARGSASCENGSCEAEGSAEASCATVPGGPAGGGIALVGMIVAGAALGRRRRA